MNQVVRMVCFISAVREQNKWVNWAPFPTPKIKGCATLSAPADARKGNTESMLSTKLEGGGANGVQKQDFFLDLFNFKKISNRFTPSTKRGLLLRPKSFTATFNVCAQLLVIFFYRDIHSKTCTKYSKDSISGYFNLLIQSWIHLVI